MKCPHCTVTFHDTWKYWTLSPIPPITQIEDNNSDLSFATTRCSACRRIICKFVQQPHSTFVGDTGLRHAFPITQPPVETIVYPKASTRPLPPEVDRKFASDFNEACLVIADSEKASAALSRRCLQNLLREKAGVKSGNLADEIQEVLDSGQLPSYLADDIDAVRVTGNFAAHPTKNTSTGEVIDVERGEAEQNLNTLEGLFDFYFVQPAKSAKRRAALNEKSMKAGKPPLKKAGK